MLIDELVRGVSKLLILNILLPQSVQFQEMPGDFTLGDAFDGHYRVNQEIFEPLEHYEILIGRDNIKKPIKQSFTNHSFTSLFLIYRYMIGIMKML